ncbi:hypothetical protein [Actinocorallia populi]|uniref:hypothetical protein n=1 Tax=Actinocorallia populi TaxID=2079200 RepID=UPI001300B1B6|nr:hypothetical protein [Actinocorallia populi]
MDVKDSHDLAWQADRDRKWAGAYVGFVSKKKSVGLIVAGALPELGTSGPEPSRFRAVGMSGPAQKRVGRLMPNFAKFPPAACRLP